MRLLTSKSVATLLYLQNPIQRISLMSSYHTVAPLIGPSVLACDMSNLAAECKKVMAAGADYLHLDVMDGHFVPNLTFGAPVVSCLSKNVDAMMDVHLMVTNPEKWVDDMAQAGADRFTFHVEVNLDPIEMTALINRVKSVGMAVGLAIKPNTPVESVFPFLDLLDQVLVMTVEPGFGGQKFMGDMMPKVRILRQMKPQLHIQVDGGLGMDTIDAAASAGANMIVAGSSIFKGEPAEVIAGMKRSIEMYGNGKAAVSPSEAASAALADTIATEDPSLVVKVVDALSK